MTNYRRRKKPTRNTIVSYDVNRRIRDHKLQVIDEVGVNLGILETRKALVIAGEKGLDLVKINPKAEPPIAKIMDWSKLKYAQSKSGVNKTKEKKLKTVRVSVRIGPHDLAVQAKKADQFLEKGHQVKLQVQMKGREKAHPEVAGEVMDNLLKSLESPVLMVSEVKKTNDSFFATVQLDNKIKQKSEVVLEG